MNIVEQMTANINKRLQEKVQKVSQAADTTVNSMKNEFLQRQSNNEFWQNVSGEAMRAMKFGVNKDGNNISIYMEHGVPYGKELEYANNRRRESIRPLTEKYAPIFFEKVERIF